MNKAFREKWTAVTGDTTCLMFNGKRAYFPHVIMPRIGEKTLSPRNLTVNEGGGEMDAYDRRAKLIAASPVLYNTLRILAKRRAQPACLQKNGKLHQKGKCEWCDIITLLNTI